MAAAATSGQEDSAMPVPVPINDDATASRVAKQRLLAKKPSMNSSFRLRSSPSLNSLRLRRMFDLFDKNGNGFISVEDMSQALSRLGLDADLSELESTISSFIRPGNAGLHYEDFVSLHQALDNTFFGGERLAAGEGEGEGEEEDLSEAFKVFDEDGDGYISAEELQVVLRKLGLPEAKEIGRVQQMIVSVDSNHDGRVDFLEFKDMMRSVLVRSS